MLSARDLIGVVPEISNRKAKTARPTKQFDTCQDIHVGDICSPTLVSAPSNTGIYRAAWLIGDRTQTRFLWSGHRRRGGLGSGHCVVRSERL